MVRFLLVLRRSSSVDRQNLEPCLSPTSAAAGLKPSKRPAGGHLADLRASWSQCGPKMVKALSTASADDAKITIGLGQIRLFFMPSTENSNTVKSFVNIIENLPF